ncbi:uncharacterized protein M421DRAFT_424349, partial [Didymella exigua CBS 183.55]
MFALTVMLWLGDCVGLGGWCHANCYMSTYMSVLWVSLMEQKTQVYVLALHAGV